MTTVADALKELCDTEREIKTSALRDSIALAVAPCFCTPTMLHFMGQEAMSTGEFDTMVADRSYSVAEAFLKRRKAPAV